MLSTTRLGEWVSRPLEPVCRWVFHLPPEAGSALLMSMIGGYPVGARTIAQLLEQGRIQPRTARRMLCFCINAGPAFVVSTVGAALYSSVQAGLCLLAAHLGASAIVGFFICTGKETFEPAPPAEPLPLGTAFVQSVSGAAQSLIGICAFVVTFSGLRSLLWETGLLPRLVTALERLWPVSGGSAFYTALLRGLLEVTDGCIAASALGGEQAFVLTAFLLSFGGVSVICQAAAAFRRLPMSFGLLFFSRRGLHCRCPCKPALSAMPGRPAGWHAVHPTGGSGHSCWHNWRTFPHRDGIDPPAFCGNERNFDKKPFLHWKNSR